MGWKGEEKRMLKEKSKMESKKAKNKEKEEKFRVEG